MPTAPKKPCRYPGCPALIDGGLCPTHARLLQRRYDAARGTTKERGYGVEWQRLRRLILDRDPMCTWPGCEQRSTDVDHIVSRRRGGTDDPSNLRGLCHAHHSEKTARFDGAWGRRGDAA